MVDRDWNQGKECPCEVDFDASYPEVFDTIIIGAGPGGMTSAVYASRRKMKTLLICGDIGGQMRKSADIQNWTGVAQATGPELTKMFFDHVKKVDDENDRFDLWVREKERVVKLRKEKNIFHVQCDSGKSFQTKSLIITTGKTPRMLGIPGEDIAMKGNGLSLSVTMDAPLYKDKKMVIIGGGSSAMETALQLSGFTNDVTLMTNIDSLIGVECLMERVEKDSHISVKYNVNVKEILLDEKDQVRGVLISEKGEKEAEFECEGIFEEVGQIPATEFARGFVDLNEGDEIITGRKCHTSVSGVFAGGDCTDQSHKQVIVAAGEGAICALEAHEYVLQNF